MAEFKPPRDKDMEHNAAGIQLFVVGSEVIGSFRIGRNVPVEYRRCRMDSSRRLREWCGHCGYSFAWFSCIIGGWTCEMCGRRVASTSGRAVAFYQYREGAPPYVLTDLEEAFLSEGANPTPPIQPPQPHRRPVTTALREGPVDPVLYNTIETIEGDPSANNPASFYDTVVTAYERRRYEERNRMANGDFIIIDEPVDNSL